MASCATPISSAGHASAGAKTHPKLTFKPDHQSGSDQAETRWTMQPLLIAKLIVLLSIANGTPVILKKVFGDRFSWPIDGGLLFFDRRPLLGPSKTIRGALASVVVTT